MYYLYVHNIAVPYLFISLHIVQGIIIYFIVHEKINIVKGRIEYLRKTALDREQNWFSAVYHFRNVQWVNFSLYGTQ